MNVNLTVEVLPCTTFMQNNCTHLVLTKFYQTITEKCRDCPLECDSVTYGLSTSPAEFPTPSYFKALINNTFFSRKYSNITTNAIDKSVLAFNVYYSDLRYTEISQLVKYSFVDFVCSVGGTIGLFTGSSLLSLGELFEVFLILGIVHLKRSKLKLAKKSANNSSTKF